MQENHCVISTTSDSIYLLCCRDDLLPHPPLLPPVGHGSNGTQVPLQYGVPAAFNQRQEQQFLLDVGSQVQQIHNLRDPRPGHVDSHPGILNRNSRTLGLTGHAGLQGFSLDWNG